MLRSLRVSSSSKLIISIKYQSEATCAFNASRFYLWRRGSRALFRIQPRARIASTRAPIISSSSGVIPAAASRARMPARVSARSCAGNTVTYYCVYGRSCPKGRHVNLSLVSLLRTRCDATRRDATRHISVSNFRWRRRARHDAPIRQQRIIDIPLAKF